MASGMEIVALSDAIGAEIRGVDLSRPLDGATIDAIKDAWHELYKGKGEEEQHCSWTYWGDRVVTAKGNNEGWRLDYCVVCVYAG